MNSGFMTDHPEYLKILEQFKLLESGLNEQDKDRLRSEMLSYLLFDAGNPKSDFSLKPSGRIRDLSPEEMELIMKLAARTDALYRLMKGEGSGDQ